MLDLLPVQFQQRRGTQQSDRCQANSVDTQTHAHAHTHVHTYLCAEPDKVIESVCEFTQVLFASIYMLGHSVFGFMNI